METSCTFVANIEWISQVVAVGSLLVAAGGIVFLGLLRDRRLEAELVDGDALEPEVSTANA